MPLNDRLERFLKERGARYEILSHPEAFTASEIAAAAHVPGREVAKVVVVRDEGGGHLMAVLPALCRLDLAALARAAGKKEVRLAPEAEVQQLFPDCEAGAMPPFGNLYGLPVYADRHFPRSEDIFFQAGNHREIVRMRYEEFEELVKPSVGELCLRAP